jgi:N-acylneuraminate cytidylyltransferase
MKYDGRYLVDFIQPKRSQDVDLFYARNGAAIYITKTSKLNEYIFGGVVLPFFMNKEDSVDLDDNFDWKVIETLMK